MTLNGDTKFKEKLTCDLKNDIRNLTNFHASSRKSENLMGSFYPKHVKFQLKKYRKVTFHNTEE